MSGRITNFEFHEFRDEREQYQILCWNGGAPFLIDARYKYIQITEFPVGCPQSEYIAWAKKNKARPVGFGPDRPITRSAIQRNTWAAEG